MKFIKSFLQYFYRGYAYGELNIEEKKDLCTGCPHTCQKPDNGFYNIDKWDK